MRHLVKYFSLLVVLFLSLETTMAQGKSSTSSVDSTHVVYYILLGVFALIALTSFMISFLSTLKRGSNSSSGSFPSVDEIIEDHDYDGIQEFDNELPPWWLYGFYGTIIFAVVYLVIYHVTNSMPLQDAEYQTEITEATILYKDIDENYAAANTDEIALKDAQALYKKNCIACHGALGEGNTIGPNLTDEYWLHKGGINDVVKTIKFGVENTAMQPWKTSFNNEQIYNLASYVLSLQGSNPPNAKEPQGDKAN